MKNTEATKHQPTCFFCRSTDTDMIHTKVRGYQCRSAKECNARRSGN